MKYNNKISILLSILSIIIFMWSCSNTDVKKSNLLEKNIYVIDDSLSMTGKLSIKKNGKSISGSFMLDIEDKKKLNMDIYAPFGILMFKLSANDSNFTALDIWNKIAYTGKSNQENIEKALQIPLPINFFVKILLHQSLIRNEFLIYENDNTNIIKSLVNDKVTYTSIRNFTTGKDSIYYKDNKSDFDLILNYSGDELLGEIRSLINLSIPMAKSEIGIKLTDVVEHKLRIRKINKQDIEDFKIIDLDKVE